MADLAPLEAARIADDVEAEAFAALYAAAPDDLRRRCGLAVERVGDATLLFAPGLPDPMFNRAIGLGLREPADEAAAGAIAAAYAGRGIKDWWLHWNPLAAPTGFQARLEQSGWTTPRRRTWAKMLRPAGDAPQFDTPWRVVRADASQAMETGRIAVEAFDMPAFLATWLGSLNQGPWRTYALLDGTQVVGGACLYVQGACSWLGVAAVAPSHRGRNGQAALMAHRIDEAARAGARHVVTETGEPTSAGEPNPSLANMRRCGFAQVASRWNLKPPAAAS
jgi:GNAT superfamily N-acetyltransferase